MYNVELETRARKELLALSRTVQQDLLAVLDDLANHPRPSGAKKLIGKEGYRVRKGTYRVLYTIDDRRRRVCIYRIGHRREVYR